MSARRWKHKALIVYRIGLFALLLSALAACPGRDSGSPGGERVTDLTGEHHAAWLVMGTTAQATVWGVNGGTAASALREAGKRFALVDSLMSSYRPESEISRVNRAAGNGQDVAVSRETIEVVRHALRIGTSSGGRFDVTVGPLVDVWSFYTAWRGETRKPPTPGRVDSALALVGHDRMRFDPDRSMLGLADAGMKMDLGAIAKGYALDLAAAALLARGIERAFMDLGGQVLMFGPPPEGPTWRIGIRHPQDPDMLVAVASVDEGSIATSGDYERYFEWEGQRYFHILDPSTGRPASGVASCTVWAPSGVDADAWSTTLFLAGPEEGRRLLQQTPEISALWILDPGAGPLTREHCLIRGALLSRLEFFF